MPEELKEFECALPIVGYAYCTVHAANEEDALQAALAVEWKDLDIVEEYTTDKVGAGNVNYHPLYTADINEVKPR